MEDDLDSMRLENPAHALRVAEVGDTENLAAVVMASHVFTASHVFIVFFASPIVIAIAIVAPVIFGKLVLQMEDASFVLVKADQNFWFEHLDLAA